MSDRPAGQRARTVFLGSGAFAVPVLAALASSDAVDLVGVVTAPPRPARRGLHLAVSPVEASGFGPVLAPSRLRDPAAVAEVLALEPALIVLADYGQIVPPALLGLPLGALNLHPSLLPRHRGASPIPAAILEGDAETGVTLMRMDAGLDTGPIVAVERVPLTGRETAPDLEARPGVRRRRPAGPLGRPVDPRRARAVAAARRRRHADPAAPPGGRAPRRDPAGCGAGASRPCLPAVARDVSRGRRRAPRGHGRERRAIDARTTSQGGSCGTGIARPSRPPTGASSSTP